MLARLSTAIATICMLSGAAFAQGAAEAHRFHMIAHTAGQLDIEGAKQAISKSTNKDVRAFAEEMVHNHTAVNKQALDLVHNLKVTPEDNDIANEVAYHTTVYGALEIPLIPSAANPKLKSLLQTGLKIFQGHEDKNAHHDLSGDGANEGAEMRTISSTDSSSLPVLRVNSRLCRKSARHGQFRGWVRRSLVWAEIRLRSFRPLLLLRASPRLDPKHDRICKIDPVPSRLRRDRLVVAGDFIRGLGLRASGNYVWTFFGAGARFL